MARPQFANTDFLVAARWLACEYGPAAVTVGSVAQRLGAPIGSFYHRFASRDLLLGELWLNTVLAFQQGFLSALDAGDGLGAALHTPAWVRANPDDARLLLLHHRRDFVQGEWPEALCEGVARQAARYEAALVRFTQATFGDTGSDTVRRVRFALVDVPLAALRPHLERRELPPPIVDELIRRTFEAVIDTSILQSPPSRGTDDA
jgi:AcrR family transcriptional regulator